MTEVNKQFIEAMQKRLYEKDKEYVGELNYKNMMIETLWFRLMEQTKLPDVTLSPINIKKELLVNKCFKEETRKKIVDIANFCWMLWERLREK